MPSMTLKNIPEPLLEKLRARATADRRSLTQEMLYLLEKGLTVDQTPKDSWRQEAEAQSAAWERLAGEWESDLPTAEEIRQILDRRSPGREVDL